MSQRGRQKPGRAVGRAGGRQAESTKEEAAASAQVTRDREVLVAALNAAEARIAALEQERLDILNRIDWVIDSLHNVLEGRS
jgi:hypothetical protein